MRRRIKLAGAAAVLFNAMAMAGHLHFGNPVQAALHYLLAVVAVLALLRQTDRA